MQDDGPVTFDSLCQLIHRGSPYAKFSDSSIALDLQGWNGTRPVFERLVDEIRPSLIIEVGAWKGQSTSTMLRAVRKHCPATPIVSVDTWLGSIEMLGPDGDRSSFDSLNKLHGYPTIYYQFLANMVKMGGVGTVVPFPQTSLAAADFFARNGISADMIYVDASHEQEDVIRDLRAYWPLVREGGVMFGDDYSTWKGVVAAVDDFCEILRLDKTIDAPHWMIRKTRSKDA